MRWSVPRFLLPVLGVAVLAPAAPALAQENPWEPDPDDTEGVYIITGTGPPNARVQLVEDGSVFDDPDSDDNTLNEGEYTSPSGQFRIDEGFCNPGADCRGGGEKPFRIVFYRNDLDLVPIWAPASYYRAPGTGSQGFNLPEVEDVPRSARVFLSASGPGALPGFATISGTTRTIPDGGGAPVPLSGVLVEVFDAAGRGRDALYASGTNAGYGVSNASGEWSLRVPPSQWAIRYRTDEGPWWPDFAWSGCTRSPSPHPSGTPPPAGTGYVNATGAVTGVDLTIADPDICTSTIASPPPDDGGGGGGGPADPPPGGGGAATAITAAARIANGKAGAKVLTVMVPGPGTLSAKATATKPKASAAKKITVARGSVTAKQAGPVKLVLKPTKAAKKLLKKGKKLKAAVKVTFKPVSGATATLTKSVTFKPKKAKKKKKKRS